MKFYNILIFIYLQYDHIFLKPRFYPFLLTKQAHNSLSGTVIIQLDTFFKLVLIPCLLECLEFLHPNARSSHDTLTPARRPPGVVWAFAERCVPFLTPRIEDRKARSQSGDAGKTISVDATPSNRGAYHCTRPIRARARLTPTTPGIAPPE